MRAVLLPAALLVALALALPAAAQGEKEKAPAKKPQPRRAAATKAPKAHARPTQEQIRKFNEMEKKQQR